MDLDSLLCTASCVGWLQVVTVTESHPVKVPLSKNWADPVQCWASFLWYSSILSQGRAKKWQNPKNILWHSEFPLKNSLSWHIVTPKIIIVGRKCTPVFEPLLLCTQRSWQCDTLFHRAETEQRALYGTHRNTGPGTIISTTIYNISTHYQTPTAAKGKFCIYNLLFLTAPIKLQFIFSFISHMLLYSR